MTKRFKIICLCIGLSLYANLTAQTETHTVQSILNKHAKAIGLEKRIKINTMISYGVIKQMGNELEVTILQKRPDFYRMDVHFEEGRITQAYDGSRGWSLNPFLSPDTVEIKGSELDQLKESAIFDGILFSAKELGYTISYKGEGKVDNKTTLILELSNNSGNRISFHLDHKKFLILKTEANFKINDFPYSVNSVFFDYRRVKGMQLPFRIQNNNGQMSTEIIVDTLRTNVHLENGLFIGRRK